MSLPLSSVCSPVPSHHARCTPAPVRVPPSVAPETVSAHAFPLRLRPMRRSVACLSWDRCVMRVGRGYACRVPRENGSGLSGGRHSDCAAQRITALTLVAQRAASNLTPPAARPTRARHPKAAMAHAARTEAGADAKRPPRGRRTTRVDRRACCKRSDDARGRQIRPEPHSAVCALRFRSVPPRAHATPLLPPLAAMGHNTSSPLHAYAPRDGPRGFGHNRDPSEEMPEESGDGSATEQAQPANREQNASPVPAAAVSAADSDPPPDPADPSVVVESTRPVLNVSMDLLGASPPAPITMPSRCSSDSAATTATAAPNSEAAAILPASSQPSAHGAPTRLPQRSVSSVDQSTNFRSPRLSPTSLSSVSAAIRSHLQTPHGLTATSSHAIPQTPQTPSLLTSDAAEQKLILLRSLFQAIDRDSTGYLEREELLAWVEHEPWLRQPNLSRRARTLLNLVNHDEDSRCSRNEFLAAFESFSTPDIITLIVNLLRAGMVAKVPRVIFVQNTHDFYRNGLRFDATGRPEGGSGDSGEHSDLSSSDTPADTLLFGTHKEEASKHFFLLEVLFQSMDRDLDGKIDTKDLHRWLRADPFIQEPDNADLFQAVDACWKELAEQNAAAGFAGPALDAAAASRSSLSVSGNNTLRPSQSSSDVSLSSAAAGPARVDRHFFFLQFSQVPKKLIRRLLVHLLSRNASSVMEAAQQERRDRKEMGKNVAAGSAAAAATPAASPTTLPHFHHPLVRKHSVVIGGSKRVSLAHGLRVSLVGQSMLQHDIRAYPSGAACIAAMRPLLTANCIFTELETALVREGRQPQKQRNSVFFHAAHPVVIDVLQDIGFNFFATANNHSGDLGEEGLQTIMEEFESRRLVQAGIGMNARRASLPSYLDTPNGRIAQVAFASKIPEHSIATNERAGVNSLSMADVDTSTLNQEELSRLLSTITMARAGFIDPDSGVYRSPADMVIAYHHNHYWYGGLRRARSLGRFVLLCCVLCSLTFVCFCVACCCCVQGKGLVRQHRFEDGQLEA